MKTIAILAAGAGLILATSGSATVYNFTFTGSQTQIIGQLIASPGTGDSDLVTSLNATFYFEGNAADSVALVAVGPFSAGFPDNLIYPKDDALGSPGSGFLDVDALGLNLGNNVDALLRNGEPGTQFVVANGFTDSGTFTLTSAAPEPATRALMLAGFAGLGTMLRTRRERTRAIA